MKIALWPGVESLAAELIATGADVYGGASWVVAVAATAAKREPPTALVPLERVLRAFGPALGALVRGRLLAAVAA